MGIKTSSHSLPLAAHFFDTLTLSEPYPGIPAVRFELARQPKTFPLTDEESFVLCLASRFIDETLQQSIDDDGHSPYFNVFLTSEDAAEHRTRAVKAAIALIKAKTNIIVAAPIAGSLPLAKELRDTLMSRHYTALVQRLHPVEVSGTTGTKTGGSKVQGLLPPELLDPKNTVLVLEDIMDSFVSTMRIIEARHISRQKRNFTPSERLAWETLIKNLKHRPSYLKPKIDQTLPHWTDDQSLSPEQQFAKLCASENVLLLPVFSKNKTIMAAVYDYVRYVLKKRGSDHTWAANQNVIKQRYSVFHIIPPRWALGAKVMDTSIEIERALSSLPSKLLKDHRTLSFFTPSVRHASLRVGKHIEELVYLDGDQEEHIVSLVGTALWNVFSKYQIMKKSRSLSVDPV